ncbi:hypothetical protein Oter_2996 [Opitutus terrae PB90-1]|uniref:Uncharacterized protein n=1 Tax=Opitutus terrae (strain DSM 11246 / JCM 15787 / PB90-1) TaxID=452637 RepID=B1ZYV4_OPITP|nr:hypothetical protein Oter_2996 [Opitutus terrae PB90-1]
MRNPAPARCKRDLPIRRDASEQSERGHLRPARKEVEMAQVV